MKLRSFESSDSTIICSWIKDKYSLYQWSADRIGKFPLSGNELNEFYSLMKSKGEILPLTAVDDENKVIGHLFIRYPDNTNKKIVRFGFVIVSPLLRGHGYGKKLLQLATTYSKEVLNASEITLGVFLNNKSACHCYESFGFRPLGKNKVCNFENEEWECKEMNIKLD